MLERTLKRKRKSGKKRKKNDDEVTDEELARDLEGWMEVRRLRLLESFSTDVCLVREMCRRLALGWHAFLDMDSH